MHYKEIFVEELKNIHDPEILSFVDKVFINLTPNYFWTVPASISGKYHPKSALGDGGLVRHVKLAVKWGLELLSCWPYTSVAVKEEVVAALLLHDLLKNGPSLQVGLPNGTLYHGIYLAEKIYSLFSIEFINNNPKYWRIVKAIRNHMGKWTYDYIPNISDIRGIKNEHVVCLTVHLADYCASRRINNDEG